MSDEHERAKAAAIQDTVNAAAVVAQVRNDYGTDSSEARTAYEAALGRAATARELGATDDDLRAARPA